LRILLIHTRLYVSVQRHHLISFSALNYPQIFFERITLPTDQQVHIEAWQSNGLSQVAYCRQHQLNSKTFANWLRVYRSQPVAAVASTLIPVEIKLEPSLSGSLCLRCPQQR